MTMGYHRADTGPHGILGMVLAVGLFMAIGLSAIAFGAAVPWGMAALGMIILTLLALWAVRCAVEKRVTLSVPITVLPIALFLLYGLMQTVAVVDDNGRRWSISMDIESTRMTLEIGAILLVGMLLAASVLTTRERLGWFTTFIVAFGFVMSVFGIIQYYTWNGKFFWILDPLTPPSSPFGTFINHNHFAGFIEMIVPIPLALVILRVVRREQALLFVFAAILMSVATIVSLSRGGMVSLISGVMFIVIFGLRPSMLRYEAVGEVRFPLFLTRIAALLVLAFTIGAGVIWVGGDSVINRVEKMDFSGEVRSNEAGKETFFQSRGWIWEDTYEMIRDNWLTGVGIGAYQTAYSKYTDRDGSLVVGQAHNDYLQVVADAGVIGGILALVFLYLLGRDFFVALRHRDPFIAGLALGSGGGIFALLVHSLFDFNLQMPSNALLFLVLASLVSNTARAVRMMRASGATLRRAQEYGRPSQQLEVWS